MSLELDHEQIETILNLKQRYYVPAASVSNVPWGMLACIHYRENNLSVIPPETPGGCMQFDPVPADTQMRDLLNSFTSLSQTNKNLLLIKGVDDFYTSLVMAACILHRNTKFDLTAAASDQQIINAFYCYNGQGYGLDPLNSPYVANGLDDKHMDMKLIGSEPNGHGGRRKVEIVDTRPGAWTIYLQLREIGLIPLTTK